MARKLTLQEVRDRLKETNPHYNKGGFTLVGLLKGDKILVKTQFGLLRARRDELFRGSFPSIISAVNRTQYAINQLKSINGHKYDYSKFVFTKSKNKSTVICRKHGEFEISHDVHKKGVGCKQCAVDSKYLSKSEILKRVAEREKNSTLILLGKDKVERIRAKETFHCKVCKNNQTKKIIDFLNGNECYWCSRNRLYKATNSKIIFYVMKSEAPRFYKVGITNNLKRRRSEIQREAGTKLKVIFQSELDSYLAFETEEYLIKKYKKYKYHSPVNFGGVSECFTENTLAIEDMEYEYYQENLRLNYNYEQ